MDHEYGTKSEEIWASSEPICKMSGFVALSAYVSIPPIAVFAA